MIRLWQARFSTAFGSIVLLLILGAVTTCWAQSQDRLVAEWAIQSGGSVRIEDRKSTRLNSSHQ